MKPVSAAAILLALCGSVAHPQQHAHPQSSETLGTVHFPTSCKPAVAPQFDRAVALLHSFEFGASIRGVQRRARRRLHLRDGALGDRAQPMDATRWRPAIAPAAQLRQGKAAVDAAPRLGAARHRARARLHRTPSASSTTTSRTRDQRTRVVAYERAMGELAARHPADTEAHDLPRARARPRPRRRPTRPTRISSKAGAILEPLWAKQPDHPGLAHYIIHTYDIPALADKARAAARRYAAIAPSAAHALHMPSHTFTRVGMWEESVEHQRPRRCRRALRSGSIAEALHALDYAMYAYLQMRQASARRRRCSTACRRSPRASTSNAITGAAPGIGRRVRARGDPGALGARAAARGREAAALEPDGERVSVHRGDDVLRARARRVAHRRRSRQARASIDSLAAIEQRLTAKGEGYWAEQVAIQQLARAGVARSRRAARRRRAGADARGGDARGRDGEDRRHARAARAGARAARRHAAGAQAARPKRAAEYRATLEKEPNRRHSLSRVGAKVTG